MCEHLEVSDFRAFVIRADDKEHVSTLQRCVSCGDFLTLDAKHVPDSAIVGEARSQKENMRTINLEINSDLYERIQDLINSEQVGDDPSKIMNELVGLGLHHYRRLRERKLAKNPRSRIIPTQA